MNENNVALKSVRDLFGMHFFVSNYQRGYRWTGQQVTDLLNDIRDFSASRPKEYQFYCLQPLVVRKMQLEDVAANGLDTTTEWHEVIDGQQRLTTMLLLLNVVRERIVEDVDDSIRGFYDIRYQREPNANTSSLTRVISEEPISADEGIDLHFMRQSYGVIKQWMKAGGFSKSRFVETLVLTAPDDTDAMRDRANNVRFIWYETVNENPIRVFTRLNIGKIELTNSELIKALLLNSSNFSAVPDKYTQLRQREIASEWDVIERTLQDDAFWLFLHDTAYDCPTRIDYLFELLSNANALGLTDEQLQGTGNDRNHTFRYFYEYFCRGKHAAIEACWEKVKTLYETMTEWYDDVQLYHYIGYLLALVPKRYAITDVLRAWREAKSKPAFIRWLKDEIKNVIGSCPATDFQFNTDGSNKGQCRPVLLFHNIQTVINQNHCQETNKKLRGSTFYKFPFHLYKQEHWDVEHVNPCTDNDMSAADAQKEWLANAYAAITDAELLERVGKCLENGDNDETDNCYHAVKERLQADDQWDEASKNRIGNYVLLDQSTNRSYGNAIFPAKRRIIISKERGKRMPLPQMGRGGQWNLGKEEHATSAFVPPCTRQVFLKYFSPTLGNNNQWTASDAAAYVADINRCITQLDDNEQ